MKIYYYKQQQNTFALFGKKAGLLRIRFLVIGLAVIVFSALGYWKFKQVQASRSTAKVLATANVTTPIQASSFDEETKATFLKIQDNIQENCGKAEYCAPLKSEQAQTALLSNSLQSNNKAQLVTIRRRDTLGKIFSRLSLNKKEVQDVLHSSDQANALKKLKPGQKMSLTIRDHKLQELSYPIDTLSTLTIVRTSADGFKAIMRTVNLEPKQSFAKFYIARSFNSSAKKAGLDSKRTAQLVNIFKSSVDLSKGNHTGDQVHALFQDYFVNGKKVKQGEIVAAEYKTATNTYQAVLFTDPKGNSGYYAPDGTSMQKRFLPAPVKFTRISSLFNPKRWHPVLHRFRHHQGVDYAAPYGTPIKSVANGTIALLGRKGGYGNTIMIKHDSSYSTLYGHLQKYASGLKVGSHVQQGQLIGYVGSSGLATGPHLHFEFRINGVHKNPLTVALPNGKSITHAYRNKFHNEVKKLLAKLDAHKNSNRG
jgi:murein DD-endopeptidase MepM/ murein hydrolase activator NlpD